MPRLDPSLLATFLVVLDCGRISAAAKALHLSQPAVTAQIRRLENALGAALFLRSVHGVTPTEAGLRLGRHARSVEALLDHAVADVSGTDDRHGPLAIAASTTIAAHVLPPVLALFRASNRDVPMRVHVGNTEEVVDEVREGRSRLGLVEGHARASGVRLEPYREDAIVPIVGSDTPFRVRRTADLETVPLLWREAGSGTRAVVERALRKAKVDRRGVRHLDLELASTEAIVGGAVAGLGVAFVSRASVRAHLLAGLVRIVDAPELVVRRTFRWALPAGGLTGTAAAFHAFAQRPPLG